LLNSKKITVGVTGGIAAYKTVELVRMLVKEGAHVNVIMTGAAKHFVNPLLFSAITGKKVYIDMFDDSDSGRITHIDLAKTCDILVVAPATANIIAKAACGIADNLLSTVILAANCEVVFCPAMNSAMYENPITKQNISKLKKIGCHFVGPKSGMLACGTEGLGRMAEPREIFDYITSLFFDDDLKNLKILITAGPTVEHIDPVRYISNRSSGKMGYSLAEACAKRGAKVILISGPVSLAPPANVDVVYVKTAEEMYRAVMKEFYNVDIIIKAAAVCDFKPREIKSDKIKKQDVLVLELEKTHDILKKLGEIKGKQFLVGFAAETRNIDEYAVKKLKEKNLDMLIANDVSIEGAGFDVDTNAVKIFYKNGGAVELPLMSKKELSYRIIDEIIRCRNGKRG